METLIAKEFAKMFTKAKAKTIHAIGHAGTEKIIFLMILMKAKMKCTTMQSMIESNWCAGSSA